MKKYDDKDNLNGDGGPVAGKVFSMPSAVTVGATRKSKSV